MTKSFITILNCRYSIWVQLPFQKFVLLSSKPKRKDQNSPPNEPESPKAQNPFSRRQDPLGREELRGNVIRGLGYTTDGTAEKPKK